MWGPCWTWLLAESPPQCNVGPSLLTLGVLHPWFLGRPVLVLGEREADPGGSSGSSQDSPSPSTPCIQELPGTGQEGRREQRGRRPCPAQPGLGPEGGPHPHLRGPGEGGKGARQLGKRGRKGSLCLPDSPVQTAGAWVGGAVGSCRPQPGALFPHFPCTPGPLQSSLGCRS